MRSSRAVGSLSLLVVATLAMPANSEDAGAELCPAKHWVDQRDTIEQFLEVAEVQSVEDVGMGVTDPKLVILNSGGQINQATFKPIKRKRQKGFWESYQAEVAAYRLDKYLGLEMVPPTTSKRINGEMGSLQFWVKDCVLYREKQGGKVASAKKVQWMWQVARMKAFDNLILNTDRNAQNMLIDDDWHIILIDHSRAFVARKNLLPQKHELPNTFDRGMVARMQGMNFENMSTLMDGILDKKQVEALIERRDKLMKHYEKAVKKSGEGAVLFGAAATTEG